MSDAQSKRLRLRTMKPPKNMTPITSPSKQPPAQPDAFLISKEPVVVPPSSQIAFAPQPVLSRKDVVESCLASTSELDVIELLSGLTDDAKSFIPFLYSYRSITKALNGDTETQLLKEAVAKGGEPEAELKDVFKNMFAESFEKIRHLQEFLDQIPKNIVRCFQQVGNHPSDVFYAKLTGLLDILYNIDHMKILKTGLVEDIRFYKSHNTFRGDGKYQELFMKLQAVIPVPNKTLEDVKGKMKEAKNVDFMPLLTGYLEYLLKLNNHQYKGYVLMPADRSAIVIGIVSVLYICGTANGLGMPDSGVVQNVLKILVDNPIVPLYAENSFAPGYILAKVTGLDISKLAKNADEIRERKDKYDIVSRVADMRRKYQDAIRAVSEIKNQKGGANTEAIHIVLEAVADMSWAIKALFSFKMIDMAKVDEKSKGKTVTTYDRSVKLNYSKEEQDALIELIGYLKSLSCTAINLEEQVAQTVSEMVDKDIQEFVQNTLERPLVVANKKDKNKNAVKVLAAIRDVFGRWSKIDPMNLAKSDKKVKDHHITPMDCMITAHQIDVLRVEAQNLLRAGASKKDPGIAKQFFKPKILQETKDFIDKSYEWYLLTNYTSTIREASNLSCLYFREVYLDMDKVIQFPVRSSLPFILAEYLLTVQDRPDLHDSMTFPFEIYNDAAYAAINTFKSQYLFKEVEAEVNLCVDMIAFTCSETLYKCHRQMAAAMEMPAGASHLVSPTVNRYNIVVRQNELQLLGSTVDFNQIATTKLNVKIRKELETYIHMITDIRYIPFVVHMVRVARTTHQLLRECRLMLDDFDTIWQKAKCFTDPQLLESGLTDTIWAALDFPHYVYNSGTRRFIVTKNVTLTATTSEKWMMTYAKLHEDDMGYIGRKHVEGLIKLMSKGELSFFVQALSGRVENELVKMIDVYTGMAPSLRMNAPQSKDELVGFFNFNSDAYSELVLPTLGTLLNSMRIIGNIIMLVSYMDDILDDSQAGNRLLSPIMNMILSLLQNRRELFFQTSGIDLETVTTHRSFASVWNILEYCFCLPKPIKIMAGGQQLEVQPMEVFGDGVIIAAHIFITLCDQNAYYKYDSMVLRTLALHRAETGNLTGMPELVQFLANANASVSAAETARLIATPYKQRRQTD